jgi:hypothetical protein
MESDSSVNFTDLLRSMLRRLRPEGDAPDPLSMVESCKAVLRERLETGRIVCLIIDNAQHLDELTVEYLMETFGRSDSGAPGENLLQVVLAGRPPLRDKLLHPWLRALNPHLGLVCHVEPLNEGDVGPYVENQLQAKRFPADLLDRPAIPRIAAFTSGNPRLINELCDRAMLMAEQSPAHRITPDIVAKAAQGLNLSEAWRSRAKPAEADFAIPNEPNPREEPFRLRASEPDATDMVGQTFLHYSQNERKGWSRWGVALGIFLPLFLIGAIALAIQSDLVNRSLMSWSEALKTLSSPQQSPPPQTDVKPPPAPEQTARFPLPSFDAAPAPPQESHAAPSQPEEPSSPQVEKSDADTNIPAEAKPAPQTPRLPTSKNPRASQAENPQTRRSQIAAQVQRAIENRAIQGVEVSVVNGTAFLRGRVASERQKRAAERAASGVDGVQRVRNEISVG